MHLRQVNFALVVLALSAITARAADESLPDPDMTPGSVCTDQDDDFDGYRYPEQIAHCRRHVTTAEKRQIGAAYGIDEADFPNYEFDHLIPLSIGGNSAPENIWPQPLDEAKEKDKLEEDLYRQLAAGDITQDDAIQQIHDWANSKLAKRQSQR